MTTPGVGYVPGYCDPWWYVCYPGGFVPVENIVGERSSTDFGMVFGGGVNFNIAFAEVRYHYIWGPTVESRDHRPDGDRRAQSQRPVPGHHVRSAFLTTPARQVPGVHGGSRRSNRRNNRNQERQEPQELAPRSAISERVRRGGARPGRSAGRTRQTSQIRALTIGTWSAGPYLVVSMPIEMHHEHDATYRLDISRSLGRSEFAKCAAQLAAAIRQQGAVQAALCVARV